MSQAEASKLAATATTIQYIKLLGWLEIGEARAARTARRVTDIEAARYNTKWAVEQPAIEKKK